MAVNLSPNWHILVVVGLAAGCTPPDPQPMARFNLQATFFDAPWPYDGRLADDGTLDFSGFPNPKGSALLDNYIAFGKKQRGFGTNAPMHLTFEAPLDLGRLPTDWGSIQPDAGVFLVELDPHRVTFGQRIPLQWHWQEQRTAYTSDNLLTLAPIPGFPLRPNTTHALVVTTELASAPPAFSAVWDDDHPEHPHYALLEDTLPFMGLGVDDIAVATVFTTTDPVDELQRMARFVQQQVASPRFDLPLEPLDDFDRYRAYRTHYPSPVFTHGERPYLTEGGQFEFDDNGTPQIASWDDMRMAVCVPAEGTPPLTGWPVVIYQHGTGGDYRGFCDSNSSREVAGVLGERGFVSIGIDQPLHGPRLGGSPGGSNDLANFNIVNPESGVTNFRQGALDAVYLARALTRQPVVFTTQGGESIPTDPNQVLFMGHSQGGLTGALAGPFMSADIDTMVLSGAGGGLSITIVERKDPLDFAALVASVLQFNDDEEVHTLHPAVGLVQTLVERTDPVNYAPYWYAEDGGWPGQRPINVLLTSGTADSATPYRTAVALAAAGRLPALHPRATSAAALDLRGLDDLDTARDNVVGFDGTPTTAAFLQWRDGSHFIVFDIPEVQEAYAHFLESATTGAPEARIDSPPE